MQSLGGPDDAQGGDLAVEGVSTLERTAALERGMAALAERMERLEARVLPSEPDPEIGLP